MTYLFSANTSVTNEVEVKNDAGNPIPITGNINVIQSVAVTDNNGSLTIDGNVGILGNINIGTMPEVEIKNDSGNPIPVVGNVVITSMPVIEVKNDTGNAIPVSFPTTNYDSFGRFRTTTP